MTTLGETIEELKDTIKDLEEEVSELEEKIDDLEDEIDELENREPEFDLEEVRDKIDSDCIIIKVKSMDDREKILDFVKTYIYPHHNDQERLIF